MPAMSAAPLTPRDGRVSFSVRTEGGHLHEYEAELSGEALRIWPLSHPGDRGGSRQRVVQEALSAVETSLGVRRERILTTVFGP
jgi:hypothetical protein